MTGWNSPLLWKCISPVCLWQTWRKSVPVECYTDQPGDGDYTCPNCGESIFFTRTGDIDFTARNAEPLTKGELFIFNWQYHGEGLSHFQWALIDIVKHADSGNLAKLKTGFPDEVEAYDSYTHTAGWWTDVQEKARKLGKFKQYIA